MIDIKGISTAYPVIFEFIECCKRGLMYHNGLFIRMMTLGHRDHFKSSNNSKITG